MVLSLGLVLLFSNLCLSSFAIFLMTMRELVALLKLFCLCLVTVSVLCPFLTVPRVGLRCVIIVFPDHTNLFLK